MAMIKNPITVIQKGGDIVNGIIEEYKSSSGTIDADTFVEFVKKVGEDTRLTDYSLYTVSTNTSTVRLDDDRVFVVFARTSKEVYGVVCTISGSTITAGNPVLLFGEAYSGGSPSAVLLANDKVFVSGCSATGVECAVCTISNTTITVGSTKTIAVVGVTPVTSAVGIGAEKVFVIYTFGGAIRGVICTISGTDVTVGNYKQIVGVTPCQVSMVFDESGERVFMAYSRDSDYCPYAVVCTISNTTFTPGTAKQIASTESMTDVVTTTMVEANKVLVTHMIGTYAYGIVCTMSGRTISLGADTKLPVRAFNSFAVPLDTNRILFIHGASAGSYALNAATCTVSGTTITTGNDTQLSAALDSSESASAVLLSGGRVFIAHNNGESGNLYGIVLRPEIDEQTIKPSETRIDGLTKTECKDTTAGKVWVLN